ncbi:ABC transporter permease [Treponema sp.]|uniref:ABC transporter permease n=1 Tax=Treponema sp. TaxID=166 RepID=UPI0025F3F0ED|nr:ABC transporter permease [Treponema sp.]MBR4321339.1 ABC transporter permease [Treponema sp.]
MSETVVVAKSENTHWTKVITAKKRLLDLHLRDVWDYRYLIKMFVKRDFIVTYKQTILGPLWYLVQPLITAVMYMFIFGKMAKVGTDGVPFILFYFAGTMLWTYFTSCLESCSKVFTVNQNVFGKVYFPRLTSPIATCGFHIIKLAIQFILLAVIFLYTIFIQKHQINISLLALTFPLIVLWIGILGGSLGLIISSLTTKYRDLNILLGFGIQLGMYATPVVYPLSELPEKFSWLAYVNPMCAPIEYFRIAFYGAGHLDSSIVLTSLGITFVLAFFGLVLFTRNERNFVDVI